MRIESRVASGDHKGDVQIPHKGKDGFYIVSVSKFKEDYIRVPDLESVANALAAGLRVRMKADAQQVPGLVMPESITIDGLGVVAWANAHRNRKEGSSS
ncbi:hypothetical protein [Roseicyclus sp.]